MIQQLTSLTVDEFETLAPLALSTFIAHVKEWTLEGQRRGGRRPVRYANCSLPMPEDRAQFVLMDLKSAPLHTAAFGSTQPNASRWLRALLIAILEHDQKPRFVV